MAAGRVMLLHGIARTKASLAKLERLIQSAGYLTLNLDYSSRRMPLEHLVEQIHGAAGTFAGQEGSPFHIVGHSMGGLLARAYIARHRPAELGRVVMLGTPNQGSELADLLMRHFAYRRFFGPAGGQLGTGNINSFGTMDYPVGVIAGRRALDPIGWLLIPGPKDGRVSVARTKVDAMADHLTLPVTHALMPQNSTVMEQTLHFLQHGRFKAHPERYNRERPP